MTTSEFFTVIAQLAGLLFVVTSMLGMGLSLTMKEIVQPLRNARLVILALLVNFVLTPAVAYLIMRIIPLDSSLQIGLTLLAIAAGAPFLPKLVQVAKGDVAFAVGLMVLLMVVTVGYIPVVLPILVPGVEVDPWAIAQSLIVLMLVPLAIGLFVRSGHVETAQRFAPLMNKASTLSILVLMVVGLGLNAQNILGLIGSGGMLALLLFIVICFALGFLAGGRNPTQRSVMGLGAAQRNISAALVVGVQNFASQPSVLIFLLVAAILLLFILMPTARRLGRVAAEG